MEDALDNIWTSKKPESLPDLIIGGAMKSGTTSLHAILNAHPDIAFAHDELGFFDIDDILQHSDFNFYNGKNKSWTTQSMQADPDKLWKWYSNQFSSLDPNIKLKGEDSTTYLCSELAAKRIALQAKPIRLIFILRHPTKRTISNYLHLLKSGRATASLEDTLRYNPNSIIRRSLYKEQLEFYYKYIPRENIKVILFEDLISDKGACILDVCNFLEVDFEKFDAEALNVHSNKTKIPRYLGLQRFRNRLLKNMGQYRYSKALPMQPEFLGKMPLHYRIIDKLHKKINPHSDQHKFQASKTTVEFLDTYFETKMAGIDELTNQNIHQKWFKNG